ncbi:MAG: 6-bladed beta-propeller [Tenuifilaceae bacterium]|jgi:hypothetical protein|nr:6-bladed beta-propeller [Tenuifilaceae bacterium]
MKRNPVVILIIISFLIISCNSSKNDNLEIRLESNQHKNLQVKKSIHTIKLETREDCQLSSIDKVCIDQRRNRIFILSNFNLYIFDFEGRFITKTIKGKGPGEIIFIPSFAINKNQKRIYALNMNSIAIINYDGILEKSLPLNDFYSADIFSINNDSILLLNNGVGSRDKYFLGLYSIKQKSVVETLLTENESYYPYAIKITCQNFYKKNNRTYFSPTNIFKLYEFSNNKIKQIASFDTGDRKVPEYFANRYREGKNRSRFSYYARKKGYVPYINYSFFLNDYLFVGIDDQHKTCYAVSQDGSNNVYANHLPLFLDLPNTRSFQFPKGIDENIIIFCCNTMDFFEHNPLKKEQNVKIGNNVISINYTDNPILVLVKEK